MAASTSAMDRSKAFGNSYHKVIKELTTIAAASRLRLAMLLDD
jgi:hypothetical protein